MKIRLFLLLSISFLLAGLLMPVGVYADDAPTVNPTVLSSETDSTDATIVCESEESVAETDAVVDVEVSESDEDTADTTNNCGDDDDDYARVSWNS